MAVFKIVPHEISKTFSPFTPLEVCLYMTRTVNFRQLQFISLLPRLSSAPLETYNVFCGLKKTNSLFQPIFNKLKQIFKIPLCFTSVDF